MAKSKRSNRDHAHQHQYPGPDNEVIAADLQALLTPGLYAQQAYFRQLGMRERILNLPLMLAAVLTLLWPQVPSVQELTRMLAREDLLWCKAVQVSQQAVSQRFLSFPSVLFERLFMELLPQLQQRWQQRFKRPLAASVQLAREHFERVWIADSSKKGSVVPQVGEFARQAYWNACWEDGNGGGFGHSLTCTYLV